ncbi:rod shape-determining protein MreC [Vaginisenegalia massiliensis]|uniref:rod shape-determining protein MreC n=1 Tax=Vaginisenegalia massiliensis TaxID=2058294 RepID=UPI000F532ADB|nr:rod shape-determining protein MreC [Vaginisenegalia massiliensis]
MINNKKLIGILLAGIAIVSLLTYSVINGASNPVTSPANNATAGVGRIFSAPVSMVVRFVDSVDNLINTFEENQHLKQKINQVYELQVRVADLEADNNKMKQELKLTESLSDYTVIHGTVIARNPDQWIESMTIDIGAKDGIEKNMSVMAGNGLIGRVVEVNKTSSKVLLLTSQESNEGKVAASVQAKKGSANGIVSGYDRKTKNYVMTQVSPDVKIEKGDKVITSGLGGVTPSTLLIGTVESAKMDDYGLFQVVKIKPAGEMTDIRFVTVIKRDGRSE